METLLAIDTSTSQASVALAIGDAMHHCEQGNIREHAQYLLPMIDQLLTQAGVTLSSLDGIVLGRGPGSFTGLRIACSVVKGLAYAHDMPIYPVSSLAAIAEAVFDEELKSVIDENRVEFGGVLTIIDARMQEVYWDYYTVDGAHLEERVSSVSAIKLPEQRPFILAGVGFEDYLCELPQVIQRHCIKHQTVFPNGQAMIRFVRAGRSSPVSAGEVLPIYVRNQVVSKGVSGG